jgi:hypothetical protein
MTEWLRALCVPEYIHWWARLLQQICCKFVEARALKSEAAGVAHDKRKLGRPVVELAARLHATVWLNYISSLHSDLRRGFLLGFILFQAIYIEYDSDHETAAGTDGDLLSIAQIRDPDLEAVAAWARVVVDLQGGVEGHVFDLDFVVDVQLVGGGHCECDSGLVGWRESRRRQARTKFKAMVEAACWAKARMRHTKYLSLSGAASWRGPPESDGQAAQALRLRVAPVLLTQCTSSISSIPALPTLGSAGPTLRCQQ